MVIVRRSEMYCFDVVKIMQWALGRNSDSVEVDVMHRTMIELRIVCFTPLLRCSEPLYYVKAHEQLFLQRPGTDAEYLLPSD